MFARIMPGFLLKNRPDSAWTFKKMRPDEELVTLHLFCRKCRIYVFFCRKCRDYAHFGVEFYAEFLAEILRNTQNFGRKSAENIGWWSLWLGV